jgi:small subunit ribosomal protein S2
MGIKEMTELPGVLFVVDTRKEHIAVAEANRLRIPIVALVDTNCDPTKINYPIVSNDDAIRAITLIAERMAQAYLEGVQLRQAAEAASKKAKAHKAAEEAEKTQVGPAKPKAKAKKAPSKPVKPHAVKGNAKAEAAAPEAAKDSAATAEEKPAAAESAPAKPVAE